MKNIFPWLQYEDHDKWAESILVENMTVMISIIIEVKTKQNLLQKRRLDGLVLFFWSILGSPNLSFPSSLQRASRELLAA